MLKTILAIGLSVIFTTTTFASEHRSHATLSEFQRMNPCPSTGLPTGKCPGYIKDHIFPLCAGGEDSPYNMQWQTVEDAKIKDRWERSIICRRDSIQEND